MLFIVKSNVLLTMQEVMLFYLRFRANIIAKRKQFTILSYIGIYLYNKQNGSNNMKLMHRKYSLPSMVAAMVLSIVVLPTAAGAATTSTTINSAISSVISLFTSNGTVTVNVTPTGAGAQTIASDTITVSTNDTLGYTLQIADTDATTTLVSGANNIAASAGTQASPIAQVVNTWGYRVDGLGGFGAGPTSGQASAAVGAIKFAGLPANSSPNTIKTTATTASNDTTTVWYGVAANTTQPMGTYSDSITYTATAN
jgi:hypothetical protein